MKSYDVRSFDRSNELVLSNATDLSEVYSLLDGEENFIISFEKDGIKCSEVIISTHLSSKVKNGRFILRSED